MNIPAKKFKSILNNTTRFKKISYKNYCATFDANFCSGKETEFIDSLESLISTGLHIKGDKTTSVIIANYAGRKIVIKKYHDKGFIHAIRHAIKGSRAQKNLYFANLLPLLNIKTANILLCLENRKLLFTRESYIVMEYIEGPHLREFLQSKDIDKSQKQQEILKAQTLFDKLTSYNITYSDPKLANLIIHDNQIYIIDLDSMLYHKIPLIFKFKSHKTIKKFNQRIAQQTL